MDIKQKLEVWKHAVLGVSLDIDGSFGAQCVDVPLSWGQTLYPGVHWTQLFAPVANAKDMLGPYSPKYWQVVWNEHNNPNQLPPAGAIAVFGPSPEAGYTSTYPNPAGTVGVVDHADPQYVYLLHQDSSETKPVVRLKMRPWRYSRCIGWLVYKGDVPVVQPAPVNNAQSPLVGKTVFLHPVPQWSVYRVGQPPVRKDRIGFLIPKNYSHGPGGQAGLTYKIIAISPYPNTVTINTDAYGVVDIYLDQDAQII